MKIDNELIDHLSYLAKLKFEGEDKEAIKADMIKIIGFMQTLGEVNTENVEPLIFMTEEFDRLRDDVTQISISQEEALKNAPKKDSDYFRIPKVLDK
ncbi:MAG: Asp-tRNA(Asn)/Glu-tRNA(Gln) amidotransferase subunit GatC [Flavobacteriia bacterium]|nr:Asp-tRNA(Asn)/Glu-tRNA(Gln) amidotransferase subunit GatC [Flavobacteriia bacterium]